jgi:pilus assembly protein Flp/PilA
MLRNLPLSLTDYHEKPLVFTLGAIPMFAIFVKLFHNEDGATAIEYGLIAALIAVAAVGVMGTVGTNLSSTFNTVASAL